MTIDELYNKLATTAYSSWIEQGISRNSKDGLELLSYYDNNFRLTITDIKKCIGAIYFVDGTEVFYNVE